MIKRLAILSALPLFVACDRSGLDVKGPSDTAYQGQGSGPGETGDTDTNDTIDDTSDTAGGSSQPDFDRRVRPDELGWTNPSDKDRLQLQRL